MSRERNIVLAPGWELESVLWQVRGLSWSQTWDAVGSLVRNFLMETPGYLPMKGSGDAQGGR